MSGSAVPGPTGQLLTVDTGKKQKNSGNRSDIFHARPGEPDALAIGEGQPLKRQPATGWGEAATRSAAEPAAPDNIGLARFRELILPHLDAAYNLARYLVREPAAADDIVQEAFLRAYSRFDTYAGGNARAWILQITRNCFLTWAKSRQGQRILPLDDLSAAGAGTAYDLSGTPAGIDRETPESELLRRANIEMVRTVVEALPAPFKEVLILREFDDLSYQEIAEVIGAPIGTVMSRLARARQLFAKAWLDSAGGERR